MMRWGGEGIGYCTAEFVVDASGDAVRGHQRRVHLHLLFRVAIARFFVPFILVFSFLGGLGVELVRQILDCEVHFRRCVCIAHAAECFIKSSLGQICPGADGIQSEVYRGVVHDSGLWLD